VSTDQAFLLAGQATVDLLAEPAVAHHWDSDSALPKMTVGALAAHLAGQLAIVKVALTDPSVRSDETPAGLADHYARSTWVVAGLDDEFNVGIRERSAEDAASGPGAIAAEARAAFEQVSGLLAEQQPAVIRMPWWGWALSFDDLLVTRMMEIAVHSDDLAVSVGLDTPALPDAVLRPVLDVLVGVSVQRHGQTAVLRALSRAERAPASIAAF
jgi:hypothetical protein